MISIPEHAGHPEDLLLLQQNPIKQSSLAPKVSICLTLIFSSRALVLLDHFLFSFELLLSELGTPEDSSFWIPPFGFLSSPSSCSHYLEAPLQVSLLQGAPLHIYPPHVPGALAIPDFLCCLFQWDPGCAFLEQLQNYKSVNGTKINGKNFFFHLSTVLILPQSSGGIYPSVPILQAANIQPRSMGVTQKLSFV